MAIVIDVFQFAFASEHDITLPLAPLPSRHRRIYDKGGETSWR
jgi:hypothetical protein